MKYLALPQRYALKAYLECGKSKTQIAELLGVCRSTIYRETLVRILLPYKDFVKSITGDNRSEFALHQYIAQKLQTEFYFAHPYASWERGLSENSNKIIRQYIPKQSDFRNFLL